jgi:acyl carrier protein
MADPRPSRTTAPYSAAERVRQVVARMTGRALVTDRMDLLKDLSLDAADREELVVAVELACRLDLAPAEAAAAASVGDLIALVEKGKAAADTALRDAIEDLAAGATARGQPIDLASAARVLAEEHRSSSLDVDAIEGAVGRAIASYGEQKTDKRNT